jgi:hypothetical protein
MNNDKYYSGNPNANFNYMTPNTMYQINNQVSNFKDSYKQNNPMIEKQDYRNQNNMLHNNVGSNILAENVVEYSINMDSADRNLDLYPNQFKFSVHFTGTDITQPCIDRKFKNIKYIRLENVILPNSFNISSTINNKNTYKDASDNYFSYDDNYIMTNNKYILLKIKELSNDRVFSTGNVIRSDTVKLYFDVSLNKFYDSWTTNQNTFVYTNGNLNNVSKLSFELFDPEGNLLLFQSLDPYTKYSNNTYLKNPLCKYTQMSITLIFGIVQNDMNTEPNYSQ